MKYSLGAIQYYWPKADVVSFYRDAAESDVDIVYLGETVCSKRTELRYNDYLDIAHQLREAGKQVCLSTMTLLEAPALIRELSRYVDNGEFVIEANDVGAIHLLQERHLPFVSGAAINCYNQYTLRQLLSMGMQRWVMPVELSRDWLLELLAQEAVKDVRGCFETEVFALGHLPLAWSARCFTARSENRAKDECELCCINYPSGRPVLSQDGTTVFVLNGIQTQSGLRYNLINQLSSMAGLVDVVRLSPQKSGTFDWLARFRANESGQAPMPLQAEDTNGYWMKLAGMTLEQSEHYEQ